MSRRRSQNKQTTKPGRKRRAKMPEQLIGARYVNLIKEQLERFHNQPAHGNRDVFLDQVVVAHLLAFFNPKVKGLRSIEDIFEHPRVRKEYSCRRLPKSTLSDAQRLFDPDLLLPLIDSLMERTKISRHDKSLDTLTQRLLAIDGSFFAVAPRITWALYNQSKSKGIRKGQIRIHVDFDVHTGVPERCTVTNGQVREAKVLSSHLKEGCLYVLDRGFQTYDLLRNIIKADSNFVVRQRNTMVSQTVKIKPLTDKDVASGVVVDRHVILGARPERFDLPTLRVVEVEYTDRHGEQKHMLLVTDLLDVPAWIIALIYKHRWQVELFFRWLKCSADFGHFFSESESGMTLQVYIMMIALLLIAVETGCRPSRYDYTIMSAIYSGMMPFEGSMEILERRRRERQRAAELQRKKRKK